MTFELRVKDHWAEERPSTTSENDQGNRFPSVRGLQILEISEADFKITKYECLEQRPLGSQKNKP